MDSTPRPRPGRVPAARRRALPLAGLAVVGLVLSGCAAEDSAGADALHSAEERISSAESRIQALEDEMDRRPDAAALQSQAAAAVSSAVGQAKDAVGGLTDQATASVQDAVDGLPDMPDAQDVQAVQDQGRVVIEYARDQLPADAAELQRRLQEAADAARQRVPDLLDVQFRVGDQTFTF